MPSCCCLWWMGEHLQHTHIAVTFVPQSVLLFSSFNVIQTVKNSTGRCESLLTSMLQTIKNYYCLRPCGCFDSQMYMYLNMKQSIILSMVWCYLIREADGRLFCSLSVGNMKLLRGILSFTLLDIKPRWRKHCRASRYTDWPHKMQRIIGHYKN